MKTTAPSRLWARAIFLLALVVCFVAALRPVGDALPAFAHADKLMHAGAFAVLSLLAWRTQWFSALAIVGLMALYGAAMEFAQAQTSYRQADVLDWLADMAGTGLALGVLLKWAGQGLGKGPGRTEPPANG